MDYILYIIAGLVLIVLIAVLVMRKNKAQKPPTQPSIKADKAATLPKHTAVKGTNTQANIDNDKRFDHIEIAQRFMEQQRYDKAIETLKRGLTERPNDNQLTLKLLAVYATIDESDNFNKVYDSIKTHGDAKSIAQADDLKALLTEEQNQAAERALPADNNLDTGFESIDFDLPAKKIENNDPTIDPSLNKQAVTHNEYKNDLAASSDSTLETSHDFDTSEQDFSLSLDDLEQDIDVPAATSAAPVIELDIADAESLSTSTVTNTDDNSGKNESELGFDFDFDLAEQNVATTTTTLSSDDLSDAHNEMTLDDEAFVLDLADLELDTSETNVSLNDESMTDVSSLEDNLALSLNSIDDNNDTPVETETLSNETSTVIDDSLNDLEFDNFVLEDHPSENNSASESNSIDELSFVDVDTADNQTNETVASSAAPTTGRFDDNTLIDDDFDFDSLASAPTATTPVDVASEIENNVPSEFTADTEVETTKDFSSRFAADFDFVKTLDSNQVTLDLASQYVQLGEYDSAKRLLTEVINQGNSEQQSQAQALLDRTA
ncbi:MULTISPECIES: FimV/HubP family polar landmark protein [unclassified Psychrobacter]|uniref:FimV/HubP family polar landmark protein n=1 Tax=unclassified Psychrobacter TaxID=196806 RepID=UPI0025D08B3A|nr:MULTISPECIES: FimV/HubP family polar landmark protein [unclassified Psychrobacter]